MAKREPVWWINGGEGWLVDVRFSPDSKALFWSTNIAEEELKPAIGVRVWDVQTKALRTMIMPAGRGALFGFGEGLAVSHDGARLAFADYLSRLVVYDIATGKELWKFSPGRGALGPRHVAITPDDELVVGDCHGGSLRFWKLKDGIEVQPLADYDTFGINKLALADDGQRLLAVSDQGAVARWDVATEKRLARTENVPSTDHSNPFLGAIVSDANLLALTEFPGSAVFLVGIDDRKEVSLNDFEKGDQSEAFKKGASGPVVVSRRGEVLAAVSRKNPGAQAGVIRAWDVDERKLLRQWPIVEQEFVTLAISADARELVIGRQSHVRGMMQPMWFEVVDMGDGKVSRRFDAKGLSVVAQQPKLSPDGHWFALGGFRDQVHLWDISTGEYRGYLSGHRPSLALGEVHFSPDGQRIAALGAPGAMNGSFSVVEVWNFAAGRHTHRFEQPVRTVCFSQDGSKLFLATTSNEILVFDLAQASSDLPTEPIALSADEVKQLWAGVGGGGAALLGPYAATLRTDLADRLVQAGEEVLPLLRPLFDIPIDQQAQSLLDEAAKLKSDDPEVRLAGARALGDMGDKIWTLIRDAHGRALTEDQLVQLKNLLREVPRQRRFHVLDDVVRSFESPAAADFLRELAASARKRGDLEGNELARMAESVLGKWKPFRIE